MTGRRTPASAIGSSLACSMVFAFAALADEGQPAVAYDADIRIACSQERGQALGECTVQVVPGEGGTTTVVARFANGFGRSLRFERGAFVRADATMSGSGTDTDWRLEDGVHRIRVDDQRYEVPADLVPGG